MDKSKHFSVCTQPNYLLKFTILFLELSLVFQSLLKSQLEYKLDNKIKTNQEHHVILT